MAKELEITALGELTPTGELESPEGVDPMMASTWFRW